MTPVSFLSPAFLWAAPLALAPFLIHLLFLSRARKLPFSDLTFLREVYRRVMPRSRLMQWLTLLVRCLLLLFLILGFSRPVLHWAQAPSKGAAADEGGVDVVILLDASYSMGYVYQGKAKFLWAQRSALEILKQLGDGDRSLVMTFSDRLESASGDFTSRREDLKAFVEKAAVNLRPTDLAPALEAAYSALSKSRASNKAIAVLSDNAAHAFRNLPEGKLGEALAAFDPKVKLAGLAWEDSPKNVYVGEVRLAAADGGGAKNTLLAELRTSGAVEPYAEIKWWLNGRLLARERAPIKAAARNEASYRLPEAPGGAGTGDRPGGERGRLLAGKVELQKDALKLDDARYFAYKLQSAPRVLCAGNNFFLKRAFGTDTLALFQADFVDPRRLDEVDLKRYEALLLSGWRDMSAETAARIKNFVHQGGGLWLYFLPGDVREKDMRLWEDVLPGILSAIPRRSKLSGLVLAEQMPGGLRGRLAWDGFELQNVEVRQFYHLEPVEGTAVWLKSQDEALLASRPYGAGKVILWTSALDPSWTNLPMKPVFTAWLLGGLSHLSNFNPEEKSESIFYGEAFIRPWAPGARSPKRAEVESPSGKRYAVVPEGGQIQFFQTDELGLYRLRVDDETSAFAVNLNPAGGESRLERQDPLPWPSLRLHMLAEDWKAFLYGRPLRNACVGLVLFLFLAEMALTYKKS
ncbi:MAG: BatA domain-containing protein [Elusimicrobia bacterium]|nr:BatA domain-containing protein [Elusimicrobiota bacterium]